MLRSDGAVLVSTKVTFRRLTYNTMRKGRQEVDVGCMEVKRKITG